MKKKFQQTGKKLIPQSDKGHLQESYGCPLI